MNAARKVGKYKGKTVSLFYVNVCCNEIVTHTLNPKHALKFTVKVLAYNANDAVNYVRDLILWPACTEIETVGAKGGITYRYIGFQTCVSNVLLDQRRKFTTNKKQLNFDL